jgi:hypothetical protein
MQSSAISPRSARPPENELYDGGCDLVEAAAAIRQLATDPRAARAVPPVLGCLVAALEELRGACAAMEQTTDLAVVADRVKPRSRAAADRKRRGFANLGCALKDARDAATAARSLAARSLGA